MILEKATGHAQLNPIILLFLETTLLAGEKMHSLIFCNIRFKSQTPNEGVCSATVFN